MHPARDDLVTHTAPETILRMDAETVNAPYLVALVRAGARFENGQLVERPDESGGDQQAA
jgi:hypothetical protein